MVDVIVVGAGLAGLVAAHEAASRGRQVLLLDQEGEQSLGGQAFWSLGGLFMVDTPEQRRMGIKDSADLALNDWMGSAGFDRPEDANPRKVAEAYLEFAAGEMRPWLASLGMRWFPVVGWAERGGALADGHGNSVPRFHLTWGTGPGVVAPFERLVRQHVAEGKITFGFRHRVSGLIVENGTCVGVQGDVLSDDSAARGRSTNREVVGSFEHRASAVVITSGGIGGNHDQVRQNWPVDRLGQPPQRMVAGVPDYVDGKMQQIAKSAGASAINEDRMWHYTEGLANWDPIWPNHGIRILPGPSSLWFDALGQRMEAPCLPGFDTLATLKRILSTGHEHSWFILTQKIIKKEFALSGSEQNPDFTSGKWLEVIKSRILNKQATGPVEAFKEHGEDFVVADTLEGLVAGMNRITPDAPLDLATIKAQVEARDAQMDNPFAKDAQVTAIRQARQYRGDKLVRTAKPHRILDPEAGPLIAVRLNILTRKSLGGLHTDEQARVLRPDGSVFDGLFAAGEVAGFGGGGYHGYNALEGTFLGGCIFSGRAAGRAV
ncbi:KsdD-like steroid dehydrogenase [Thalassovita autumnalis]|uniref:KsdD-like steroid dehydrogenase n=1 Tax=Thalassovita autumnalis TaxID=2072972 RepID=A0A0P1F5L8_9RHOB|nr:FAD-binding dehydrogenase [Thalassovita autumnalis]CUH63163.1 KsdD-like steroid dehydrogenase [Thalassovita autumnalis]CUH72043.1 KsdD-like steroid dehydrogenase [Thalassovita autumnalis]